MKRKHPKSSGVRGIKRILIFSLVGLTAFLLLTAQIKQGDLSPAYPIAQEARNTFPRGNPYQDFGNLSATGGIAFFQAAQPVDKLSIESLDLEYQPGQPDGKRLKLNVNGKEIECSLPDWQFIPIARYVNSPYNSCVSLSGSLVDKTLEQKIKQNNGYVLNYHPAFANTVLGWYLKQVDMLMLDPYAIKTPMESDIPLAQKESAFRATQDMLHALQLRTKGKHRSWLISEEADGTLFDVIGNELSIEADISIHCWRYLSDAPSMNKNSNRERMSAMKSILQHEIDTDVAFYNKGLYSDEDYRRKLVNRLVHTLPVTLAQHYQIAESNFSASDIDKLWKALKEDDLSSILYTFSIQQLVDIWSTSTLINSLYHIVPMEEYNRSLKENRRLIREVNPDAWDITLSAMKYSAFFRYVEQEFPAQWQAFMKSVNQAGEEDLLQTPTVLYHADNLQLKHLFN